MAPFHVDSLMLHNYDELTLWPFPLTVSVLYPTANFPEYFETYYCDAFPFPSNCTEISQQSQ